MANLILHAGSNQGQRAAFLQLAATAVSNRIGPIYKMSAIYETAAWGITKQSPFLNQAWWIQTELSPQAALEEVLDIERENGRKRDQKWGPRIIDIDLIFYDDIILESATLMLPHPWMQQRRFVLVPLVEIIPEWKHPVLAQTVQELLAICKDEGEVELWAPDR